MHKTLLLVTGATSALAMTGGASPAFATAKDRPDTVATIAYAVKYHFTGGRVIRVGTANWGYTHVKRRHGWSSTVRVCIQDTFNSGKKVTSGTTDVYTLRYQSHWFKVVYQRASKNKGVITAYGDVPNKNLWICGWRTGH